MSRPRQIKSTDGAIWRVGRVRNPDGARARVVLEPLNRKIKIAISGANKKEALFHVRNDIERIHETLNNPEVQKMVPCVCGQCRAVAEPGFFKHETLKLYREKNVTMTRCEKSAEEVTLDELLAGIKETQADKASAREYGRSAVVGIGPDQASQPKPADGGFFSKLSTYLGIVGVIVTVFVAYFALRDSNSFQKFCREYELCRKAFALPKEELPPRSGAPNKGDEKK